MSRVAVVLVLLLGFMSSAEAAKGPEYREAKKLYKKQKYAEALKKLRAAAKKEPRRASVRYLMGLALSKLGRPVEAEAALLEAKRLDPGIGFTSRAKFTEKLKKAQRRAAAMRPVKPRKAPRPAPAAPAATAAAKGMPMRPVPLARPAPEVPPPAPVLARNVAADEGGAPLWTLILLGVCGGFLGLSFLRELVRRGR